jgi:hypothetical protein
MKNSYIKMENNIWLLGKNNLEKFGACRLLLTPASSPATQVVVSKTEAIRILQRLHARILDRFE